jgi:glycosyltransferase involved in cell wall biosynthesis
MPIYVDFSYLDEEEPGMRARLRDGRWNILFVGRLVPNKRVDELLRFFVYYHHVVNPGTRLMVIGASWLDGYTRELWRIVEEYRLAGSVMLPGGTMGVSDRELASFYRSADVFMTMSEHEGFCVPLAESMKEGLPIVAYAAAAVPETLGGSGILFTRKAFPHIAEVVEELRLNAAFRERIISGEKRRFEAFRPEAAEERLRAALAPFLS